MHFNTVTAFATLASFAAISIRMKLCRTRLFLSQSRRAPTLPRLTYYVCHNGFKGCSTNPSVCDLPGETTETAETPEAPNAAPEMPPSADPPAPYRMCPEDWTYVVEGACPSGFKGCVPDANSLCGPQQSFHGTCPESLGQYYVCSNGFKGCSTNPDVCSYTTTVEGPVETTDAAQPPVVVDTPADNNQCGGYPSTPSQPSNNTENATISNTEEGRPYSMCPEGHAYVVEGACPSGFLGCTADATTVCPPPRRFWGTCPTGHGNYYVCSNGFKGCSTNANVCDL
ncbi:hypothetical protein BDY21DRAFT_363658 [Lineolata rhizophorae]|uniref:Uncharacterized protein n=1 Tax=Lineolata rhizophorae TaxID=578093 RepID=A0A6A6P0D0_9PEZI|nr:hypothetical protein BDY21DRAFT_363658 [Lineolata rhizophorae]